MHIKHGACTARETGRLHHVRTGYAGLALLLAAVFIAMASPGRSSNAGSSACAGRPPETAAGSVPCNPGVRP